MSKQHLQNYDYYHNQFNAHAFLLYIGEDVKTTRVNLNLDFCFQLLMKNFFAVISNNNPS